MQEAFLPSDLVITGAHCVEPEVCRRVFLEGTYFTHAGNTASCMCVRLCSMLSPKIVTKWLVFGMYAAEFSDLSVSPAFDKDCSTQHRFTLHGLDFLYRGADKSLDRPGRKQASVTEDFEFHISYL